MTQLGAALRRFLFITGLLLLPLASVASQPVTIGVLALWGEDKAREMWTPTARYLDKKIPSHRFVIVPLTLNTISPAIESGKVDFVITNSRNYVELEAKYGITRLATLITLRQGKPVTRFGAVIITRSDRKDIKTLEDLKGKSFMGVKETAFGGFQMAWLELSRHGIDPFSDFSELSFSGFPQDKIVEAVLAGKIDAGTVRSSTLERMEMEGKVKLNDLFVFPHTADSETLDSKAHKDFPFAHSTDLYPEWPIARRGGVPSKLSGQVGVALLSMSEKSRAARAAHSAGWTVPLDYQPIHELMKELRVGPYKDYYPRGLLELSKEYWWVLLTIALMIPYVVAYVIRLREKNISIEKHLEETQSEWNSAMDLLDDAIYLEDLDGKLIRANKAFYNLIGKREREVAGTTVHQYFHPKGTAKFCAVKRACQERRDDVITMEKDDPANEMGFPMETTIKIVRDHMAQPTGVVQRIRDLSQIRERELVLQRAQERFSDLLESAPDAMVICDRDGKIVLVNAQCERVFGFRRDELIGEEVEILIPSNFYDKHAALRKGYSSSPDTKIMGVGRELVAQRRNGEQFYVEVSLSPFESEDDFLITASVRDITERKEAERELKRLASFPELSPVPVVEITPQGQVTFVNPIAVTLFPDLEVQGFSHPVLMGLENQINDLMKQEEPLICDIVIDGAVYEQNVSFISDIEVIRVYFWDITSMHDLTKEVAYRASHDSLTGLINRHEFEKRLDQILRSVFIDNAQHALCYFDLDQFKLVNDTCGHIAGDELLKQLTSTIKNQLRSSDTFARLGGDEFGLLMIGCTLDKAEKVIEALRDTVANYRFSWDGKLFAVGASFGLVPITNDNTNTQQLLSAADSACYLAKEQGRNRVCVYRADNAALVQQANDMNWTHRIHHALEIDRLVLHYQPIISLKNKDERNCEVLVRMEDDHGVLIPPSAFIPAAERYQLMSSIDLWVLRTTLSVINKGGLKDYRCSINLSGQTLGDPKAMEFVLTAMETSGVDPARVGFEVTETAIITNLKLANRFIRTLRRMGCQIALDDFGSGLSSFSYLKSLPVDAIKIDGSFVKDIAKDPISAAMVKSINEVGHVMNLKTIAEFVEDTKTLNKLTEIGIDYAQGYLISKPIPLDEFVAGTELFYKKVKISR